MTTIMTDENSKTRFYPSVYDFIQSYGHKYFQPPENPEDLSATEDFASWTLSVSEMIQDLYTKDIFTLKSDIYTKPIVYDYQNHRLVSRENYQSSDLNWILEFTIRMKHLKESNPEKFSFYSRDFNIHFVISQLYPGDHNDQPFDITNFSMFVEVIQDKPQGWNGKDLSVSGTRRLVEEWEWFTVDNDWESYKAYGIPKY